MYAHRYCACATKRANVAGRIRIRVSRAESGFLGPTAMMMIDLGLHTSGRGAFPASIIYIQGARINAKAAVTVPIPASSRGYGIGYCTASSSSFSALASFPGLRGGWKALKRPGNEARRPGTCGTHCARMCVIIAKFT